METGELPQVTRAWPIEDETDLYSSPGMVGLYRGASLRSLGMVCNRSLLGFSAQQYVFCSPGGLLFLPFALLTPAAPSSHSKEPQGPGRCVVPSAPTTLRQAQATLGSGVTVGGSGMSAHRQRSTDLSLRVSTAGWSPIGWARSRQHIVSRLRARTPHGLCSSALSVAGSQESRVLLGWLPRAVRAFLVILVPPSSPL